MKRKYRSENVTKKGDSRPSSDTVIRAFDKLNTGVSFEGIKSPHDSRFDSPGVGQSPTPILSAPPVNLRLWSLEPRRSKLSDLLKQEDQQDPFVSSPEEKVFPNIHSPQPCTPGSHSNFPSTPNKSCIVSDQVYQSPYWSKPVSMNPFSPIPLEHLNGLCVHDGTRINHHPVSSLAPRTPPSGRKKHVDCMLTPTVLPERLFYRAISKNGSSATSPASWHDAQRNILDEKVHTRYPYPQNPPSLIRSVMDTSNSSSQSRFNSDFQCLSVLGRGTSGEVYKVLSRLDGCLYAIKMSKSSIKGDTIRSGTLREVHALSSLSNRSDIGSLYIVRYHQAWIEDSKLFFQTELCETSLREELQKQQLEIPDSHMKESRVCKVFHDISLALDFIHRQGIVHLDIKPENIFLKDEKYKLGDFGLASKAGGRAADEGDSRYLPLEMLSDDENIDLTKVSIL